MKNKTFAAVCVHRPTFRPGYPGEFMKFDFATLIYTKPSPPALSAPGSLTGTHIGFAATVAPQALPDARFDPEVVLELWRERSAIMSVNGGLTPEEADDAAWVDVWSSVRHYQGSPSLIEFMPLAAACYQCGCRHFANVANHGLECIACGTMAWIRNDASVLRGDYEESDFGFTS